MRLRTGQSGVFRDMSLYAISDDRLLVTACDAAGGIGLKEADTERAAPESVGYFCARVALLELLTLNAVPCSVSCTLGVEREPTGRRLLAGVHTQLREESLDDRIAFTVSSENNFRSVQTSIGVTMTGLTSAHDVPWGAIRQGDRLALVGTCLVGRHAEIGHSAMVPMSAVHVLVGSDGVREVVPVGSGGVRGELSQLATRGVRTTTPNPSKWQESGGPSTAVLVIVAPDADLAELLPTVPVEWIGRVNEVPGEAA